MSMREEIAVWTNLTEPRVRVSAGCAAEGTREEGCWLPLPQSTVLEKLSTRAQTLSFWHHSDLLPPSTGDDSTLGPAAAKPVGG